MPKNRPGRTKRVTATKAATHGDLVVESNFIGTAVKTLPPHWNDPFANQQTIAIGEKFTIINKGTASVKASLLPGINKGDAVYIATADNSLSAASGSGKVAAGRVDKLAGEDGQSALFVRVDLDAKDSI